MEANTKWVLGALVVLLLLVSTVALVNLSSNQKEVATAKAAGLEEGKASVDITADNAAVAEAAAKATIAQIEEAKPAQTAAQPVSNVVVVVGDKYDAMKLLESFSKDNLALGDSADKKVVVLKSQVEWDGDKYDTKYYVELTTDVKIGYSLLNDQDLEKNAVLMLDKTKAVKLYAVIKDSFSSADISEENPLELPLFDQKLLIVKAEGNKMTLMRGAEAFLKVGQELEGVTLLDVSSNKAVVKVGESTEVIAEGKLARVGGKQVYVSSVFSRDAKDESSAILRVGADVVEEVVSGDEYNANFNWLVDAETATFGLETSLRADAADEPVLKIGDSLDLLGFAKLSFLEDNKPSVQSYELEVDNNFDIADEETNVVVMRGQFDLVWSNGDEDTVSEVIWDGSKFLAKDDSNDYVEVTNVKFADTTEALNAEGLGFLDVSFSADWATQAFTSVKVGDKELALRDHDVLTSYGVVLESVRDNSENGLLVFSLPEEKTTYKILVQ